MRTYEAVFILNDRKVEGGPESFADIVARDVEELGGAIRDKEMLGRKQFARPIGRHRAGTYWDFIVHMQPDQVDVLRERYRLSNQVLRLEIFQYEAPPPSRSESTER